VMSRPGFSLDSAVSDMYNTRDGFDHRCKGGEFSLPEEIEETEETKADTNWLGIRKASQQYDVAISYLYKLAYDPAEPVKTRILRRPGKIRREVQFLKADLDRWEENRPERFKKKTTISEQPGRMRPALRALDGNLTPAA
jgi:hypothetical protein